MTTPIRVNIAISSSEGVKNGLLREVVPNARSRKRCGIGKVICRRGPDTPSRGQVQSGEALGSGREDQNCAEAEIHGLP
jgi:hypothetical protein